jgi:hypothetical protein
MTHVKGNHRSRGTAALLVTAALVLLGACSDSDSKSDSKQSPPTKGVGLDAVDVGACGAPATADLFVSAFTMADCTGPHAMELAGRYTLTDATYPGHTRLYLDAYRDCQPIFESYVGAPYWDSKFDILTITPSPSSWAGGDRTVTCMVVGEEGAPLPSLARGDRR